MRRRICTNRMCRNAGRHAIASMCLLALAVAAAGCQEEEAQLPPEEETVAPPQQESKSVKGLFLLNEGNMGANSCTLDYFDYATGAYQRNIYPERNPGVPLGLEGLKRPTVVMCVSPLKQSEFLLLNQSRCCLWRP